jgi:uncharacterized protein (DUF488 family)
MRSGASLTMTQNAGTVWTIGHSTRSLEEFLELLALHQIKLIADIRRFPGSRKYPHFGADALRGSLGSVGISYVHFPELGGRRRPRPDSHNEEWRNQAFRGYADYMETSEFRSGIERLTKFARAQRTVLLCSEAVWWRCHRSLVSDYLKAHGFKVQHILSATKTEVHPYTTAAQIEDRMLTYHATPLSVPARYATFLEVQHDSN